MDILHILSYLDFQVLAGVAGISQLYGVRVNQTYSEQEMMYCVHELVKRGILKGENGQFSMEEPYRTIFRSLKNSQYILAMTGIMDDMRNVCIYIGDKLVAVEDSLQDQNAVRIGVYEPDQLKRLMKENGFMPKAYMEMDIAMLQSEKELTESLEQEIRECLFEPKRFFLLDEKEQSGKVLGQYLIFSYGMRKQHIPCHGFYLIDNVCNYWIARKDGEQTTLSQYSEDSMFQNIIEAMPKE